MGPVATPMAGPYRLLASLGGGGTATVWAALDPLGRTWAVKVQKDPGRRRLHRIYREYQLQSWMEHPCLVTAVDVGLVGPERGWVALERVTGVHARRWVRAEADTIPRALHVASQVASALATLHAHGIVHADVKPGNLMVEAPERVRLLDLGLAQWTEERWEKPGYFGGTFSYASPEQIRREPLTPASDVFSLATTVYSLATGASPFEGADNRPRPGELPGAPAPIAELLLQCLQDDPLARPTVAEIALELSLYARRPDPEPERLVPPLPDLGPAQQQLLALLAIAGAPVEMHTLAEATGAAAADLLFLLDELHELGLVEPVGASWRTDAPLPDPAPWNEALAQGLLRALDPAPGLAGAHARLHLGQREEAAEEALAARRTSDRLLADPEVGPRLADLDHALRRDLDVTTLDDRDAPVWAALGHPGTLAPGFDAARRGDGASALALALADDPASALLAARGLVLQGRHSAAVERVEAWLQRPVEALCRCLLWIELGAIQLDIGRVRLADEALRAATLPARPPPALLARRARVQAEIDRLLGRRLDPAALLAARAAAPTGADARVLAALELMARPDDDDRLAGAIAAATAPGDDLPDIARAAGLAIRAGGALLELPPEVEGWLALPGSARARLDVAASAFRAAGEAAYAVHARRAAALLLPRWSAADRRVFEVQPWWQSIARTAVEDTTGADRDPGS